MSERYEGTLQVFRSTRKASTKTWIYERLGPYGNGRSVLRFTAPTEIRGVALLVVSHSDGPTELWMWIPAEGRDRRVVLQNRSTHFFGTDFTFEDLEERKIDQYDYELLGVDTMGDARCWKIESKPKLRKSSQYTSSILWFHEENYVLLRLDNLNKDRLVRRLTYSDIQRVDGIWTARTVEVTDGTKNSRTLLHLDRVQYNISMKDEDFTRDALRR